MLFRSVGEPLAKTQPAPAVRGLIDTASTENPLTLAGQGWVSALAGVQEDSVDVAQVEQDCAFLRHARDNAATLPEYEWRAALSLWIRCADGKAIAHTRSEPYPWYTPQETDAKIQTVQSVGPYTCAKIRSLSGACAGCPHQVTTPLVLGRPGLRGSRGEIGRAHV